MPQQTPLARPADIVEAIEMLTAEMNDVALHAFEPDKRKRWLGREGDRDHLRGEPASPARSQSAAPANPVATIAGIGNVIRHNYERIAYDILWNVVRLDLPALDHVCREELAAARSHESGS